MLENKIKFIKSTKEKVNNYKYSYFEVFILANQLEDFIKKVQTIDIVEYSGFFILEYVNSYIKITLMVRTHSDYKNEYIVGKVKEVFSKFNDPLIYHCNGIKRQNKEKREMTKQEFDEKYVGKNILVHCETEELANEFLDLAHNFGYRWIGGQSYKERNNWDTYENKTYYHLGRGQYGEVGWFPFVDYTVLKFESLKENKLDLKLEIPYAQRLALMELKKEGVKINGGYKEMKYLLDLEKVVFNEEKGRTTLVFKDGWGRIRTSKAQLTKGDKYNEKLGFLIAYVKRYFDLKVIDNAYNRYGKYQTQLIVHLETMLEQAITKFTNLSLYQIYKLFDNLDKNQIVFGDGENRKVILIERK